jgi:hypothetical protein
MSPVCEICGKPRKKEYFGVMSGHKFPVWVCPNHKRHDQSKSAIKRLRGYYEVDEIKKLIFILYNDKWTFEQIRKRIENG